MTCGYIVGEIIRRLSGKPIAQALREEVAAPLGVADELFFAIPSSQQGRLAWLEDAVARDTAHDEMFAGLPDESPMPKIGPPECTLASYGNRADAQREHPGRRNGDGAGLARMYAALLGEVDGVGLISPERLRGVSAVAASGVDRVVGFPTARGLGYSIGQSMTNVHETQRVFGVGGVGGSHAYADKAAGVTFALTKNRLAPSFETAGRCAPQAFCDRARPALCDRLGLS